ncbi:MAG: M48 family metallopeptidase [Bacteroidales bacterium]|nr:M48 family metallopeptidase [Bacteroidales bacterium]
MNKKIYLISALLLLTLSYCSKVPITGRKQLNMVPDNLLLGMSLTNYKEYLTKNPPVASSDASTQLVKRTGTNISGAVENYLKNNGMSKRISDFKWEFNLINNSEVNAWCMPGGKVAVYTGILPYTSDETGLAVVLGHEIAHAVARHGNERMSQQLIAVAGGISLAVAINDKPELTKNIFLTCYNVGSSLGILAYSRMHEYEADKLGLLFMAMAGYDPNKAVNFWEKMSSKSGAKVPEFLSTHPSDANRIKAMRDFMPEAMKHYKK